MNQEGMFIDREVCQKSLLLLEWYCLLKSSNCLLKVDRQKTSFFRPEQTRKALC